MTKTGKIISLSLFSAGIILISLSISILPWWSGKNSYSRKNDTVTHEISEKMLFSTISRTCKGGCKRIKNKVDHRSHFEKVRKLNRQISYHTKRKSNASLEFISKLSSEKKRAELKAYYGLAALIFYILTIVFIIILVTMKLRGQPLHGKMANFAIPLTSLIVSSAATGLFASFSYSDVAKTPSIGLFAAVTGILCLIGFLFSPLMRK